MYLPALTDRELVHHADVTFDVLSATDLQVELTKRFTAVLDELDSTEEARALLDEYSVADPATLRTALDKAAALDERAQGIALLDVLREFDIDSPDELKKTLQRDAKVADLINDLAQPLAELAELAGQST